MIGSRYYFNLVLIVNNNIIIDSGPRQRLLFGLKESKCAEFLVNLFLSVSKQKNWLECLRQTVNDG